MTWSSAVGFPFSNTNFAAPDGNFADGRLVRDNRGHAGLIARGPACGEVLVLGLVNAENERARARFKTANRPGGTRAAERPWPLCLAGNVPGARFFRSIDSTRSQVATPLSGSWPIKEMLLFPTHL